VKLTQRPDWLVCPKNGSKLHSRKNMECVYSSCIN